MDSREMRGASRWSAWWVRVGLAALVLTGIAPGTEAQETDSLFIKVGTLTRSDGGPLDGPVSLDGDTAIVGTDGVVYVFTRTPALDNWHETATLVPSDGAAGFGRCLAIRGDTTIVGADGAAYVFRGAAGGQTWAEVAKLTGDTNAFSFGCGVAVSGPTIVIGAPVPDVIAGERGPGLAYVFEEDRDEPNTWHEVARLTGMAHFAPGLLDGFGGSVSVDDDTVVVGGNSPTTPQGGFAAQFYAYVFSRGADDLNPWSLVSTINVASIPDGGGRVMISDDVIVAITRGAGIPGGRIFERDRGAADAWGQVAVLPSPGDASISHNLVAVGAEIRSPRDPFGAFVYARNQGGHDAWGEVWQIRPLPFPPFGSSPRVAISGDTLVTGNAAVNSPVTERTPLDVYVADTDRDGLRDGADPCPRDPQNNVAGNCQRASAIHPVLDELIAQGEVTSETRGRQQIITATFTNTSDTAVQNPFFEVIELTGRNVLVNGDAGRGRIGATLSPDVGDGILSPGESMTVTFRIRLRTRNLFQFFVTLHGDPVPQS